MEYVTTIGLEIHCELKTATKIFCGCPNVFGGEPNTHCCPVCSGYPGVLPVLNRTAVEYTALAGLALGCKVNIYSKWDRKNYFYPDLPKAWQTSQYDLPIVGPGTVEYRVNGETRTVRINRIHLEEDAGKLVHEGGVTKVDYNRCGVPLMEIVTEPDIHSAEEAVAFLDELKSRMKYIGVSDVKMQEGSLRCDVNLSVAPAGQLGTRTETKNLNSFRAVSRSIAYEAARQIEVLENGGTIEQETRRWDDAAGEGYPMRSKEDAHDYRYFPEPDLLPVIMSPVTVDRLREKLPRLRHERIAQYVEAYKLSAYDADILTADRAVADLFDGAVALGAQPKKASNYIMSEILRKGKTEGSEDVTVGVTPEQLHAILALVDDGTVSLAATRDVLDRIWLTDESPAAAVDALGLKQNNDSGELEAVLQKIIADNPKVVADYKSGNPKVAAFFVGQAMKATKGKANPKLINELLSKLLG